MVSTRALLNLMLAGHCLAQRVVRVRYGYFAESRPIHTACARGWLDFNDGSTEYRVTCYPQTSGGFAVSKLDDGLLDLALLGSTPMAQAAARGIPLSVIYISHYMGDSQGIYVRASDGNSSYKEIGNPFDLAGRKIGVPFGSTMHYQVLFLVDLFGLSGKVEVIDMSPSEIIQAWREEEIDGAGCWGEARDYLLKNNDEGHIGLLPAKTLMSAGVLADWGRPTYVVLAAHRDFAEEHGDFVTHFLAVLSRINDSFLDKLGEVEAANVQRWNAQAEPGLSFVPSMVDTLMKAGESPRNPSQAFKNLQRRSLDLFIQQTAEEQLSCDYLGFDCDGPTLQHISLQETADFLLSQKIIASLGILQTMGRTCQAESTLCGSDVLDATWLFDAHRKCSNCYQVGHYSNQFASDSTLLSELERLDLESGRSPFAPNEIGRAHGGETSRGESTCSGHKVLFADNDPVFGDGANAERGKSYSDGLACSWEIRGSTVVLEFEALRVWSGDYIKIFTDTDLQCRRDSPNKVLLAQYSSFYESGSLPPVVAMGCMLVQFETDANQERSYGDVENRGDGFQARASTSNLCIPSLYDCGCIGADRAPSWGPNCGFRDFCIGTSFVDVGTVWLTLSSSGIFDSETQFLENISVRYPNNLDCTFELHAGKWASHVEVQIWYDVEQTHDALFLSTGAQQDGTINPYVVLTGTGERETYYIPVDERGVVSIQLSTDSQGRRKGFFGRVRSSYSVRTKSHCSGGFSGTACEIPHCSYDNQVAYPQNGRRPFDLGRVTSQPADRGVPFMPWAPEGGCKWPLDLAPSSSWRDAVGIRLNFISPLDLEAYPQSSVGDSLVIRTNNGESRFFVEECKSDENCGMEWQTGICTDRTSPRRCTVKTTVEVLFPGASFADAILTTDRNDGGTIFRGLDFEAVLVDQCPEQRKDCEEIDDAECVDGYCVCKDGVPCACPCGAGAGQVNVRLVLGIIIPIFVVLFAVFLCYRRKKILQSRRQKDIIEAKEAELEAFRKSVVGMRIATKEYLPAPSLGCEMPKNMTGRLLISPSTPNITWCWRETDHMMSKHSAEEVYGDPSDCWIKYGRDVNGRMEAAYIEQGKKGIFSPLKEYVVDFESLIQTKTTTGFQRDVQRVVEGTETQDADVKGVDLDAAQVGSRLPEDLSLEPQMVLVTGDIVQISSQRNDGWAFGTKLYHADEAVARQLVQACMDGVSDEEANIFTDTGWFEMAATDIPSGDALAHLQDKVGDTDALAPPPYWSDIADPTIVELHTLEKDGKEYQEISSAFRSTLKPPKFTKHVKIVRVSRIQNLAMWQSYKVKLQTMCYRETGLHNGSKNDNAQAIQKAALERLERRWLWHGTNPEVMEKIMQQGFNRSFCGKNATMYGKGVYHARDASYSAHPLYSVADSRGFQYMMANRVAVGEYCHGEKNALTPAVRDQATQSLYDSTVGVLSGDTMDNPSIYVTYHDAQAYPEYLVQFKTSV